MNDRVTYASIHELLERLGFTWQEQQIRRAVKSPEPHTCIAYRHEASNTMLWLPSKEDRIALSADLMSVRAHLIHRGLVNEDDFAEFVKEHRLAAHTT